MTSGSVIGQDQKARAVERSACEASAKQCCTLGGREPRSNIYYCREAASGLYRSNGITLPRAQLNIPTLAPYISGAHAAKIPHRGALRRH